MTNMLADRKTVKDMTEGEFLAEFGTMSSSEYGAYQGEIENCPYCKDDYVEQFDSDQLDVHSPEFLRQT